MAILKEKSEQNEKAANLLSAPEIACYASVIHCLYYSVFQLSKHILANYCNKPYTDQDIESKGKDSHFYIMNTLASNIEKTSHFDYIDYLSNFEQLKKLRKKADYFNEQITTSDVKKAKDQCKKIKIIFHKNYTII